MYVINRKNKIYVILLPSDQKYVCHNILINFSQKQNLAMDIDIDTMRRIKYYIDIV